MTTSQIYQPKRKPVSAWHEIRGVRYHVYEWGERDHPLLVLLHGWGDCGASFQFLVDELPADRYIVAPDWRGFGRSHHRCESYWFPDYVADLDSLLARYRPEEPVDLLGHSMGANVAGLYAGIFPERVGRFVNVEGFGLADSDPAGAVVLRADPAHKLPNAVLYRRAEAEACWQRVRAAVLLVTGDNTDFRAELREWIDPDVSRHPFRGAPTVVIPGAGHMVHFEAPAALAAAVHGFLDDVAGPVVPG